MNEGQIEQGGSFENLRGKKVLMVDDEKLLLTLFGAQYQRILVEETLLKLQHVRQTGPEIAQQIIDQVPDVILMDFSLQGGLTGVDVILELKKLGYEGKIVGFSNNPANEESFKKAGTVGNVIKDISSSEEARERLSQINDLVG